MRKAKPIPPSRLLLPSLITQVHVYLFLPGNGQVEYSCPFTCSNVLSSSLHSSVITYEACYCRIIMHYCNLILFRCFFFHIQSSICSRVGFVLEFLCNSCRASGSTLTPFWLLIGHFLLSFRQMLTSPRVRLGRRVRAVCIDATCVCAVCIANTCNMYVRVRAVCIAVTSVCVCVCAACIAVTCVCVCVCCLYSCYL